MRLRHDVARNLNAAQNVKTRSPGTSDDCREIAAATGQKRNFDEAGDPTREELGEMYAEERQKREGLEKRLKAMEDQVRALEENHDDRVGVLLDMLVARRGTQD